MKKTHDELERLVEVRTAEIVKANNRLREEIEKLKHSCKSLRESDERCLTLLDVLSDLVFTLNAGGRFTYLNDVIEKLTGLSAQNLIGRPLTDLLAPEYIKPILDCLNRTLSGEIIPICDVEFMHKEGKKVPVGLKITPLLDSDGNKIGSIGIGRDITDRKYAEKKIEHLNLVLRTIRKINKLITREKDPDTLIQHTCNNLIENRGYQSAWIALFDKSGTVVRTADAGLGDDFILLVEQLKRGKFPKCVQSALKQSEVTATENPTSDCPDCPLAEKHSRNGAITIKLQNGGRVYGILSVSLSRDLATDKEEQNLVEEVAEDITFALNNIVLLEARKKVEQTLQESEETFRKITSSAHDAIIIMDNDGNISYWNRASEKVFGYTSEEVLGKGLHMFLAPRRFQKAYLKAFNRFKNTGQGPVVDKTIELAAIRKGGEEFPIELSVSAVQLRGKWNAIGILRDIGQTKQMIRELEETRAYTRGLIESSMDALVTFDKDGIITDVNKQTARLTGCTREELIGSRFATYFTDPKRASEGVKRSFEEGAVSDYELVMKSKTGDKIIVSYNATVYKDKNGAVKGVFAAARDIGDRKRVEKELKEAKEAAEAASRAKSEFLANMSHEIRTPMNGVIAAAELALNEEMSPKAAHYLKIIESSAYSLLGIINDILDFSKIEADKLDLEIRPFSLDEVIDSSVDLLINKAPDKGIEFIVDIDLDTPKRLIGDPVRLKQILTNLISNAVKFTEKSGIILLGVKDSVKLMDQVRLTFFVRDTGIGIAPEHLPTLFESFSQADSSTTRKHEGTGLGLSICKKLVEMMDGEIWVETELGKGSTFTFTACFGLPDAEQERKLVSPSDIEGLKILVVDDCPENRAIMKKMLEAFGFQVKSVASGEESLRILEGNQHSKEPFELVMMDWIMPGIDGIETARRIRIDLDLTVPIILMTAFGKENERMYAENVGINAFLTKPIYQSTLFNAIMDAFGKGALKSAAKEERYITTKASIYKKRLRGIRMLVAEDNPTNQEIALAVLEGAGIFAEIANTGKEAVESVRKKRFDAVLMDIQMPDMDGYEATKTIRKDPRFASLPIIAMTAHAMKGDEGKCLEAGMDGYVSKPINQEKLFHTLWKAIESQKIPARSKAAEDEGPAQNGYEQVIWGKDLPAKLPGINIRDTLNGLKIDSNIFKRILIRFLKNNKDTINKIRSALDDSNSELLAQLAHSLKGSAANIGANDLHDTAHELEMATRKERGKPPDSFLIDRVETSLNQVLESLQSLVGTPKIEPLYGKMYETDPAQIMPLFKSLADAMELAEPEEVSKHMEAIKGLIDISVFQKLESHVNNYDYEKAIEVLKQLGHK